MVFGDVLARGRPIPEHLGGVVHGKAGDVAGLAGHRLQVGIDALIFVGGVAVAVGAGHLLIGGDDVVIRQQAAQDDVVFAPVAVGADQVLAAHVHIQALRREVQGFIQVAVLDAVAAAAVEVAGAAVLARGGAHALGGRRQVNALGGVAKITLAISCRIGVADQAVHVGRFVEIEGIIFPAVTSVTAHALLFIALAADAEVVDLVLLANGDRLVAPGHLHRLTLPGPVGGAHQLLGRIGVAFQAGGGDFLPGGIGAGQQVGVAGMDGMLGQVGLGVVAGGSHLGPQDDQRDDNDRQGDQQANGPDVTSGKRCGSIFHVSSNGYI